MISIVNRGVALLINLLPMQKNPSSISQYPTHNLYPLSWTLITHHHHNPSKHIRTGENGERIRVGRGCVGLWRAVGQRGSCTPPQVHLAICDRAADHHVTRSLSVCMCVCVTTVLWNYFNGTHRCGFAIVTPVCDNWHVLIPSLSLSLSIVVCSTPIFIALFPPYTVIWRWPLKVWTAWYSQSLSLSVYLNVFFYKVPLFHSILQ